MAVTVTATLLGTYTSKVTAAAMSSATGSVDILTIPHLLGTTPDYVAPIIRSVVTAPSGGVPNVVVLSYNGSQAVLHLPAGGVGGAACNIVLDVVCQYVHSIAR